MPRNVQEGVVVEGLAAMQRVLRKAESELGGELKKRLKEVGADIVAPAARTRAPHGLRQHPGPKLAGTIKVSSTQRGASVYSTSPYGGVQNFGGRVGRHRATVLQRGQVSQYMTEAVRETRGHVSEHVEGVLDWLTHELES